MKNSVFHDILITTTGTRDDLLNRTLVSVSKALNRMNMAHRVFRLTLNADGCLLPKLEPTGREIVHRIVSKRYCQGIAFAVREWLEYLTLTENYYDGSSARTPMAFYTRPVLLTMLQDDVEVDPDLFLFMTRNYEKLFVEHPGFFSGYHGPEHEVVKESITVDGRLILRKAMSSSVHLSASWETWQAVKDIPKTFGPAFVSPGPMPDYAPDRERGNPSISPQLGDRTEHWLCGDAPNAPLRSGIATWVCPGMVKHIGEGRSTWKV